MKYFFYIYSRGYIYNFFLISLTTGEQHSHSYSRPYPNHIGTYESNGSVKSTNTGKYCRIIFIFIPIKLKNCTIPIYLPFSIAHKQNKPI